ncbi:MAG: MFS transporter [Actinomycetota bacterium]
MQRRRHLIWAFSALSAALAAGYGVLFTIVGDIRDEYGLTDTAVGLIVGVGFLSAFVSQLTIAPVADRGRARQVVVAGVLVNVLGLLMMGFGTSLTPILTGRIVSGIGIGAALPAIRRIVILAAPDDLGRNLGRLLSADVFGFAMGPAVSAILVGPFGLAAPFVVVSAATGLLVVAVFLVEVTETVDPSPSKLALDLLGDRAVAGAVVLGAGAFLMIGGFDALWDVVHEDLDTPTWMANLGITLFALPLIILGPTGGALAQRVGPYRMAALGLILGAGFMTTYGLVPTGTWIFGVSLFHAVSDGLTIAAAGVAISIVVPEHRQAGAQGLMGGAQALTAGITAIAIGATYDAFGRTAAYSLTAVGMVAMIVGGMALAAPTWRPGPVTGAATPAPVEDEQHPERPRS